MPRTASYSLSMAVLLAVSLSGAMGADPSITIVTLGDSYINGHGISDPADRFSAKVSAGLLAHGHDVVFQDVGFTNMSSDALRWLQSPAGQQLLANPAHHVLILETAQNDCRLLKLDASKANLDQILAALSSADIPVLIVGTVAYDFCGADYVAVYPTIFADLATKYGELLYPDFKAGIEGRHDLLGYDYDHANAAGEAIIAANILPSVEALIAGAR